MFVLPMKLCFFTCVSSYGLMLNNYDIDCGKNIWLVHPHLKLDSIKTFQYVITSKQNVRRQRCQVRGYKHFARWNLGTWFGHGMVMTIQMRK